VILFLFLFFRSFVLSFPPFLVIRGRSNKPTGTFRHLSTRFWLRLLVWRMKSKYLSPRASRILVGFVSELFLFLFFFLAPFD
jgi:hypothetical protein